MSTLQRWLKFNAVGVLGAALQLSVIAALNHLLPGHDLLAVLIAVETTLLHNFAWHWNYTWRDHDPDALFKSLLRFHVSVGVFSLAGNAAVTHVLVQIASLPLVAANLIAIVCCSLLNFLAAQKWVFTIKSA